MIIQKNAVVTLHYTLLDESNTPLESSSEKNPFSYLHGFNNIIDGLENALSGLREGDETEITLEPLDAYGVYSDNKTQRVPVKHLINPPKRMPPGTLVRLNTEKGPVDCRVIKPGKFMVHVDTNHPYAGKTLTFKVAIIKVREAEAEEIAHGHAHGIGGHKHD